MIRCALILGGLLAPLPAISQTALVLLVDGVPGPSTIADHSGWFTLNNAVWGIDRSNASAPHTLSVSLDLSANVATLAQASANGTLFRKIVIDNVFQLDKPLLISRLTCEEALIREYSSSAEAADRTRVKLDIRCTKLTWENFDYASGALVRGAKGSWNFKTNTP